MYDVGLLLFSSLYLIIFNINTISWATHAKNIKDFGFFEILIVYLVNWNSHNKIVAFITITGGEFNGKNGSMCQAWT